MRFKLTRFSRPVHIARIICIMLVMYAASLIYTYNAGFYKIRTQKKDVLYLNNKRPKYILIWTAKYLIPPLFHWGNTAFVNGKCKYTNCIITANRKYFIDQTEFDAVLFEGVEIPELWFFQLPYKRSPRQKYIFTAVEPADSYPVCSLNFEGYFNWTWTYRLDSEFYRGYIVINNLNGSVIGPSVNMKWLDNFNPIDAALKLKLSSKFKTAAWFVSHCSTAGGRKRFVNELQKELKAYQRTVDIYGACGNLSCPKEDADCYKKLENDYYFYLSFENSFSEDYVTEKLLHALNNYAVPVVYGTANYSRFLPPGSYLDALELGPKELARRMNDIISDSSKYHDFFRWRNHYKYRQVGLHDQVCELCKKLNDEEQMSQVTVWKVFGRWWNGKRYKHNCWRHWWLQGV